MQLLRFFSASALTKKKNTLQFCSQNHSVVNGKDCCKLSSQRQKWIKHLILFLVQNSKQHNEDFLPAQIYGLLKKNFE